jgi:hypothetical protein
MSGEPFDYSNERQRHEQFVGREALLAHLDALLVADGVDRWVVVTGGPGIGKSAILSAWLTRREAAGAIVDVPGGPKRRFRRSCEEPRTGLPQQHLCIVSPEPLHSYKGALQFCALPVAMRSCEEQAPLEIEAMCVSTLHIKENPIWQTGAFGWGSWACRLDGVGRRWPTSRHFVPYPAPTRSLA